MRPGHLLHNLAASGDTFPEALRVRNVGVLVSLLGPAWRGFLRQDAKGRAGTQVAGANPVHFDWTYERDRPHLARLHSAAKRSHGKAAPELTADDLLEEKAG